jgi:hypothetical protein
MATKPKSIAIKASESVVAGLVAKILGVTAGDTLHQVLETARESDIDCRILTQQLELYPWLADVPAQVMADKPGPLIDHVAAHSSETIWVVKDSFRGGTGGVWLVTSSFLPLGPWRGMFNTFLIGNDKINVIVAQLESCQR